MVVTLGLLFGVARPAWSNYTSPSGLNPRDHYRLIFETSVVYQVSSSVTATYNQYVNRAAANNGQLPATT